MKIGLVHGRFQPFHNGHKFLVDKMLEECDLCVILIGSALKQDKKNPFTLKQRKDMLNRMYGKNQKIFIGANLDLDKPLAKDAQWDVVLSSCVLTLTGFVPTHVYSGSEYSVPWKRVKVKINKYKRLHEISGTEVKGLIIKGDFDKVKTLVPKEIFRFIKEKY